MGLEEQLIRGAGEAVSKDPYGRVQRAMDKATEKITSGLTGIGTKLAEKRKEREAEEEKLEKEQEAKDKANSDAFDANEKEWLDNQGLGPTAWGQASDLAKGLKTKHTACNDAEDPQRCRREVTMELKSMSQLYADQKAALDGAMDTKKKIDKKELALSGYQSDRQKDILAGLNDGNSTHRMKNDDDIAEMKELISKCDSNECRAKVKKDIENLEKSNTREVGYDIPGVGFVGIDELADLQPHVHDEVTTTYKTRVDGQNLKYNKLKKGAEGGEEFDIDESKNIHGRSISKENITSIYYDPVLGTEEPLKDQLLKHPVFTDKGENRLSYSSLGLPESLDTDDDGFIDADELGTADKQRIINALSDPNYEDGKYYNFKRSKDVAAGWMALNEEKEANKTLYGKEYYPKGDPPYTIPNYLGEGDMPFNSEQEYQEALKKDRTTLRNGGRENEADFLARNGIKGMMQSGTVLVDVEGGVVEQTLTAPGNRSKYNKPKR